MIVVELIQFEDWGKATTNYFLYTTKPCVKRVVNMCIDERKPGGENMQQTVVNNK